MDEKMLQRKIKISEIFCSIQGEGIYTGTPSIFIRFQGCSSCCAWCDTGYGQSKDIGKEMTIQEILDKVSEYPHVYHIVITGGEPLESIEGLKMFLYCLRKLDSCYFVTVETNGTLNPFEYALSANKVDFWSISPKLQSAKAKRKYNFYAIAAMLLYKGQLKFVISDEKDINEMFSLLSKFMKVPIVIVQPNGQDKGMTCAPEEYSKRANWLVNILLNKYKAFVEKYDVRIMLQTHKVIWGNKRGI